MAASNTDASPCAILAADAPARTRPSNYPEPFASMMDGRIKHPLGDLFGLDHFGVNLTQLPPGCVSALHHVHSRQEEFIYVLEGRPTLLLGEQIIELQPGSVAGFPAGGQAHHLHNRTAEMCVILEVGCRTAGDTVAYPSDDIQAVAGADGKWQFTHKDGSPY